MPFIPEHKEEVEQAIITFEKKIAAYHYPKNLYETRTICRCILSTIYCLIKSSYTLLESDDGIGFMILARSLIEHTIDQRYIALSNNSKINQLFADYYKLSRYWVKEVIEYADEPDFKRIDNEYYEYVTNSLVHEIKTDKNSGIIYTFNRDLDKYLKNRFKFHGWSGLGFTDRINWLIKQETKEEEITFLKQLIKSFGFLSNFIHPSAYSSIPHFNFKTKTFSLSFREVPS